MHCHTFSTIPYNILKFSSLNFALVTNTTQAAVDNSANTVLFKEDLLNIARTTLSSKLLNVEKDHFAALAVDAVLRLKGSGNLDHIQVTTIS